MPSAKHHPRPFSPLYLKHGAGGEKGGVLESTLRRLGSSSTSQQEFATRGLGADLPALLSTVGAAAVVFLMTFVIPASRPLQTTWVPAIPLPTLILLEVSGAIQRAVLDRPRRGRGVLASRMCSPLRAAGSPPIGCSWDCPSSRGHPQTEVARFTAGFSAPCSRAGSG